nr:N-6 DNA methylase [uncultured Romboutsia sp.]
MNKLEKILGQKTYLVMDKLRGKYVVNEMIQISNEVLFLSLLSFNNEEYKDKLEPKNIKETLLNGAYLKDVIKYIPNIIDENNILTDILKIFDDEEFKIICNEYNKADIFALAIDLTYRNSKVDCKTSPNINELISRLLRNKDIKNIYDPTIGTGLLIKEVYKNHSEISIYGQDISQDALNICKMMLILDNKQEQIKNIEFGNTLINPMHIQNGELQKFDCIVSSPPFGLKNWGDECVVEDKYNRFNRGIPTKNYADFAFISHIVESLNDKGCAVVVVTGGVLFRGGIEGEIRKKLLEENLIECVIGLPNNMMYGTALPINLLILNKNKNTDKTLFIDVASNAKTSRILTTLTNEMIEKIGNTYENYKEEVGFSKLVSIEEIKNNDYNLSILRYIKKIEESETIDIDSIKIEIKTLEEKLKNIQIELSKCM